MSRVVAFHSFRGGTGKSNTTANVAVMAARRGLRVGVIDTDIQSPGIHVLLGIDQAAISRSLNDYLWGRCAIAETAHDVTATLDGDARGPRLPHPVEHRRDRHRPRHARRLRRLAAARGHRRARARPVAGPAAARHPPRPQRGDAAVDRRLRRRRDRHAPRPAGLRGHARDGLRRAQAARPGDDARRQQDAERVRRGRRQAARRGGLRLRRRGRPAALRRPHGVLQPRRVRARLSPSIRSPRCTTTSPVASSADRRRGLGRLRGALRSRAAAGGPAREARGHAPVPHREPHRAADGAVARDDAALSDGRRGAAPRARVHRGVRARPRAAAAPDGAGPRAVRAAVGAARRAQRARAGGARAPARREVRAWCAAACRGSAPRSASTTRRWRAPTSSSTRARWRASTSHGPGLGRAGRAGGARRWPAGWRACRRSGRRTR